MAHKQPDLNMTPTYLRGYMYRVGLDTELMVFCLLCVSLEQLEGPQAKTVKKSLAEIGIC